MKKSRIRYIHSNVNIKTVQDLLNDKYSPFYNMKENDFLNTVGEDGLTNKERIEQSYVEL